MEENPPSLGHHARTLTEDEVEKLKKDVVVMSEFQRNKLEVEARKNWDLFYKRNSDHFFKNRYWTKKQFEELTDDAVKEEENPILLEVGCGVGNFIFPLLEAGTKFFIYACDFSPRAISIVKENPLYDPEECHAFDCDVTSDKLASFISPDTVNVATLIFVLSAVHPDKMLQVLSNIYEVLKPGGIVLLRDYGLYDHAMLRFRPGHKISENFYVRQDGTRAFYFSEEYLTELGQKAGFSIIQCKYITRETVNRKESICVPRVYIQAKFTKPETS